MEPTPSIMKIIRILSKKTCATFTPLMASVYGVFAPQLNTSVKLLAERPGEKFGIEYGMMVNYARINMSVLRASRMCIRGTRILKSSSQPFML